MVSTALDLGGGCGYFYSFTGSAPARNKKKVIKLQSQWCGRSEVVPHCFFLAIFATFEPVFNTKKECFAFVGENI